MALNCRLVPAGALAAEGVALIDVNTGAVTTRLDEPEIVFEEAVIMVLPWLRPDASPAALTLATVGIEEDQVTEPERFCVLPSEYLPVAANCCVVPEGRLAEVGLTVIDNREGDPTTSEAEPLMLPDEAVIVALPLPTEDASPAVLMLATLVAEELQLTVSVRF